MDINSKKIILVLVPIFCILILVSISLISINDDKDVIVNETHKPTPKKLELVKEIEDIDKDIGSQKMIYVDDKHIWTGTYNGTLYIFDKTDFSLKQKNKILNCVYGIRGDDSFTYVVGPDNIEGTLGNYLIVLNKNDFSEIATKKLTFTFRQNGYIQEDSNYGVSSIAVDDDFIYLSVLSIDVDDNYIYHSTLNNRPVLVFDKELNLIEEIPGVTGLNIYYKNNYTLLKNVTYEELNLVPCVYSDDEHLYTGDQQGYVNIYEKTNFEVIKTLTEVHDAIEEYGLGHNYVNAVFTDDYYLYVGTEWWKIRVYNKTSWEQIKILENEPRAEVRSLFVDDDYLYAGSSLNPRIVIYE